MQSLAAQALSSEHSGGRIGSYTFSHVGMGECARFVAQHGIDVDALFTDRWKIEDAETAYKEFDRQVRGKAVIEF
ncbi:hypothetical protein [Rhodococcus koreensis]